MDKIRAEKFFCKYFLNRKETLGGLMRKLFLIPGFLQKIRSTEDSNPDNSSDDEG